MMNLQIMRATNNVTPKAKLILAFALTAGSRYAFFEKMPCDLPLRFEVRVLLLLPLRYDRMA
jgi:hypothetical protein